VKLSGTSFPAEIRVSRSVASCEVKVGQFLPVKTSIPKVIIVTIIMSVIISSSKIIVNISLTNAQYIEKCGVKRS
jgi:hypothetical protein